MNPINPNLNQIYSDDFHKFVLQDHQPIMVDQSAKLKKKFSLDSTKKNKKADKKADSPWLPNKKSEESADEV